MWWTIEFGYFDFRFLISVALQLHFDIAVQLAKSIRYSKIYISSSQITYEVDFAEVCESGIIVFNQLAKETDVKSKFIVPVSNSISCLNFAARKIRISQENEIRKCYFHKRLRNERAKILQIFRTKTRKVSLLLNTMPFHSNRFSIFFFLFFFRSRQI